LGKHVSFSRTHVELPAFQVEARRHLLQCQSFCWSRFTSLNSMISRNQCINNAIESQMRMHAQKSPRYVSAIRRADNEKATTLLKQTGKQKGRLEVGLCESRHCCLKRNANCDMKGRKRHRKKRKKKRRRGGRDKQRQRQPRPEEKRQGHK
jgi:hypothetical protein